MNELIQLEDIKAPVLYGSDDEVTKVIESIQTSAKSIVCNVETAKGRKETASLAAKVAKSKTYLDSLGKDLVSGIKAQAKEIDSRRKTIRDTLDDLKEEVRKPLTEFENKEKERIAAHELNIDRLQEILVDIPSVTDSTLLDSCIDHVADITSGDYQEYTDGRDRLTEKIKIAIAARKTELLEAIRLAEENARLKKEAEERAQKDREDRIAREAVEKARREEAEKREAADRKAKAEREAEQQRLREAEDAKLQADRDALEAQRREIEQAKEAEFQKKLAAEQAERAKEQAARDALEAEKRHQEQLEAAAQAERDRIAEEQRKEEAEASARAADKAHRAAINNRAVECMVEGGVSVTAAKKAVTLIAQGKVEAVTITY